MKKELEENFEEIKKEDLIRYILQKDEISEKELIEKLKKHLEIKSEVSENIPITIFTTVFSPLESLTKFLKENKGKKLVEISRITGRCSAALSVAYKNTVNKKLEIKETRYFIPLNEFEKNKDLSVLEVVVNYLENQNLGHSEIAEILKRDVRTIWTLNHRAIQKINSRKGGKK